MKARQEPTKEDYKLGAIGTFSRDNVTNMKLHYGMKGVMERTTEANFQPGEGKKYTLGLHDLSATLLTQTRKISDQRKRYTGAVWVFMPVP